MLAGCQPPAEPAPTETPSDFDFTELSDEIRPQDDFWGFVNARWLAETEIPADRSSYGVFHIINDRNEARLKTILEESLDSDDPALTQLGDLYGSFMDEAHVAEAGLDPLKPWFQRIDAIEDRVELTRTFGELAALRITTPVRFYADNDAYDPTRLLMIFYQWGLGLPDRAYYVEDNPRFVEVREQYRDYLVTLLKLAERPAPEAAADAVLALESEIAKLHWTSVQNRDREKIYSSQYGFAQAEAATPGLSIRAWLEGYGAESPELLVIAQGDYFAALGELIEATDLSTWQAYLSVHVLNGFAPYLSEPFSQANFDFRGRVLRGAKEQPARWRRALSFVNASAGELLGRYYVERHFPERSKQEIGRLVENLRDAFRVSINELEWMSDATKAEAQKKLEGFIPKLGYPDTWRDFSGLSTDRGELVANVLAARRFAADYGLAQLAKPVDKTQWTTYPHIVNAMYRPTHNSITFPAGILQTPFFDPDRDPALNYGAIGSIIGHEFSHGFDDQGRKFDGQGLLRNWWIDQDGAEYRERSTLLIDQYAGYQPLPDRGIDGALTLGENIGDLAGVIMSFRAFELSGQADGPAIAGYTPRQRFFLGYAAAWRSKYREPYARELLVRDPHSPPKYRVLGVLPNVPAFHDAFDTKPGDGMYVAPDQVVKIW